MKQSANSLEVLVVNLNKVSASGKALATGTNKLVEGIASSKTEAERGIDQLIVGTEALQDGSKQTQSRLKSIFLKTNDLSDGLLKLKDGSIGINNGLSSAQEGALQLQSALTSGYNEINDNLKFNSDDMSKFIGNPVTLEEDPYNNVAKYGEGLAPYFISLSLWIGIMILNLAFTIIKRTAISKYKILNTVFSRYIVGLGLVTVQALILTFLLRVGLHMENASSLFFVLDNIIIAMVFFTVLYSVGTTLE